MLWITDKSGWNLVFFCDKGHNHIFLLTNTYAAIPNAKTVRITLHSSTVEVFTYTTWHSCTRIIHFILACSLVKSADSSIWGVSTPHHIPSIIMRMHIVRHQVWKALIDVLEYLKPTTTTAHYLYSTLCILTHSSTPPLSPPWVLLEEIHNHKIKWKKQWLSYISLLL